MGFPNIDLYLTARLKARFVALQADAALILNTLFEDLDPGQRTEIARYIQRKKFTTDIRDRQENQVYILPTFPMLDMPFPQIAISLGQESPSERFMGDTVGESTPVTEEERIVAWDIPKGYFAHGTYNIDVAAATKEEAIWLSRFVQRFIMEDQDKLSAIGAIEVDVSLADMKLENGQEPITVFNRRVTLTCKLENTWVVRIPAIDGVIANNIAL